MITEIRDYVKARISDVDSNLNEWTDVFNLENIPETIIDDSYHIKLGPISMARNDDWIENETQVEINLFKKGYRDVQDAHDTIFDKSILVNLCLSDITKFNSTFVRDYRPDNIESYFFSSNDNLIIIKITGKIITMLKSY